MLRHCDRKLKMFVSFCGQFFSWRHNNKMSLFPHQKARLHSIFLIHNSALYINISCWTWRSQKKWLFHYQNEMRFSLFAKNFWDTSWHPYSPHIVKSNYSLSFHFSKHTSCADHYKQTVRSYQQKLCRWKPCGRKEIWYVFGCRLIFAAHDSKYHPISRNLMAFASK